MKKFIYSITIIAGFVFYVLVQSKLGPNRSLFDDDDSGVVIPPANIQVNDSTPPTDSIFEYKDGSYTGLAADTYYGLMQVKAVINGGKITDVIFLKYPNDRPNSIRVNTQAMPYLKAEAIKIQSYDVDTVTGASDSSQGFRESLQSALEQAKI